MPNISSLEDLREFYNTGATRPRAFRKEQLKKLKQAILDNEEELYAALNRDLGKSPEESWVTEIGMVISEINLAIRQLDQWMAPEPVSTNLVNLPSGSKIIKEPLGVVLVIGPWNYPFQLLVNPVVGAIAAGNCVVMKPSEHAPATSEALRKIIESTFPREYILLVEGEGATVIPAMMNGFRFDHIFYTGSTEVGRLIYKMAADKLTPVTLELGGKSPCVVESDADIKTAARRIAITKYSNAGQMCVAPDYLLVHASVKERLLEELRRNLLAFFGEKPEDSYSYGKIINEKQFNRLTGYLKEGKLFYGGRSDREKLFIDPTIITDVPLESSLMKEEIFGPILPVLAFTEMEEARAIIQRNPDPLSFYVYTSSSKKEKQWIEAIPAGGVCVN
ncbi:MAG TPA: aldehyde dehydrogenase family protein, partial [Chitinophagaceae bacterium]|nr:aldehyde dehydrogenase family protein [Chitinophagaceae bacterium]